MGRSTIYSTRTKAISRGWQSGTLLRLEHVIDAPKSGRPHTITDQRAEILLSILQRNSTTREFSTKRLARECSRHFKVSHNTIHKWLRKKGFKSYKTSKKPGLQQAQKEARYRFCLSVMHWTLEQ
jgi:transposase